MSLDERIILKKEPIPIILADKVKIQFIRNYNT